MEPSKLELLTVWLPTQPWFVGDVPELERAGGFRLDDPAGEVGMEVMFVRDIGSEPTVTYCVPMTYRGAPLEGGALIGTSQHGVLGQRWIYDGPSDPVFHEQARAFLRGEAMAQHQSLSDTPDPAAPKDWASPETGVVRVRA
jgi:hypothetical protein